MTKEEVLERIRQIGVIPAIRPSIPGQAVHAAEAICQGGVPIIEISVAMPNAFKSLEAVRKAQGAKVIVGAGTVITREEARRAWLSGAQFIVTPGFSAEAVEETRTAGLAVLAGALTPTEVQLADASGADAVKLFPCYAVGGPRYLRSLLGQYPNLHLIASGGVTLENCIDYIRAGACAVGVGGEIGDAGSMAAGDHRLFTERARRFRKAVAEGQALWMNGRQRQVG